MSNPYKAHPMTDSEAAGLAGCSGWKHERACLREIAAPGTVGSCCAVAGSEGLGVMFGDGDGEPLREFHWFCEIPTQAMALLLLAGLPDRLDPNECQRLGMTEI